MLLSFPAQQLVDGAPEAVGVHLLAPGFWGTSSVTQRLPRRTHEKRMQTNSPSNAPTVASSIHCQSYGTAGHTELEDPCRSFSHVLSVRRSCANTPEHDIEGDTNTHAHKASRSPTPRGEANKSSIINIPVRSFGHSLSYRQVTGSRHHYWYLDTVRGWFIGTFSSILDRRSSGTRRRSTHRS